MDWLESIKIIRHAQENNQLVIFVGAGVSKNSGMPSWTELIASIAEKIGYQHGDPCYSCERRDKECPKIECEGRHTYTQDELLRIPEYYFQSDTSDNHMEYYDFIQTKLRTDNESNPIDNEIFNLIPHHIITTNYDSLLERSNNSFTGLYTVVSQDSDLLSKANERYIIKMHGDLAIPKSIVLKESDYIDYEQDHPLISTFIRSLLVNHTFLFLGYSLNDYNLNLIIGWINYFQKKYMVEERPKNFLITNNTPFEYEQARQESKNIFIIDISSIPNSIIERVAVPDALNSDIGRKMFTYLRAISDPTTLSSFIPLEKTLEDKYATLKSYNKISYYDFIQTQNLGRTFFAATELVFYDDEWYEKVLGILQSGNKHITECFIKAGITAIHNYRDDSSFQIPNDQPDADTIFTLYENNDYQSLRIALQKDYDVARKIYYLHLLGAPKAEIDPLIKQMYFNPSEADYISILLCKMRERLATLTVFDRQEAITREIKHLFDTTPVRFRHSIGYLKMLFESTAKQMVEMQELLEKQEKRNEYGRSGWESGHAFTHIWKLQALAYDYYFFFKENYLPFDYYSDAQRYLSYYIQAILCSYTPVTPKANTGFFEIVTDHKNYSFNDIDLDIIVKYTESKKLRSWLKKYCVQALELNECSSIFSKYVNLCDSYVEIGHMKWPEHILNFTIILCSSDVNKTIKEEVFTAFVERFEKAAQKSAALCEPLFESLFYFIKNSSINVPNETKSRIIGVLLQTDVYKLLLERHKPQLINVFKQYGSSISRTLQDKQLAYIEGLQEVGLKIKELYYRRFLLPMEKYRGFLSENTDLIDTSVLFEFLIENRISFSQQIQDRFINTINAEHEKRKANPNVRSFPDWLTETIDECIILKLCDFDLDLSLLTPFAEYSFQLQFMLNPESFDYSNVDVDQYMWQNLIYSKEYREYFVKHKKDILSPRVNDIFSMGLSTTDQQKIVYGILLDDDELRQF